MRPTRLLAALCVAAFIVPGTALAAGDSAQQITHVLNRIAITTDYRPMLARVLERQFGADPSRLIS